MTRARWLWTRSLAYPRHSAITNCWRKKYCVKISCFHCNPINTNRPNFAQILCKRKKENMLLKFRQMHLKSSTSTHEYCLFYIS